MNAIKHFLCSILAWMSNVGQGGGPLYTTNWYDFFTCPINELAWAISDALDIPDAYRRELDVLFFYGEKRHDGLLPYNKR